jgi:thymidylate synthase (FAD)
MTKITLIESGFELLPIDVEATKERIERIGRTCYRSEGKIEPGSASKFIKMLNKRGHGAMLEHSLISVCFTSSRAIADELFRHRAGTALAMESTRYCNYKEGIQFVIPTWVLRDQAILIKKLDGYWDNALSLKQGREFQSAIDIYEWIDRVHAQIYGYYRNQGDNNPMLANCMAQESEAKKLFKRISTWVKYIYCGADGYAQCIIEGLKPQEARGLLPLDIATHAWVSGNLRAWQHIFQMRNDTAAHPDMQNLMADLENTFQYYFPELFPVLSHSEVMKRLNGV